jgi:hypothetical protein
MCARVCYVFIYAYVRVCVRAWACVFVSECMHACVCVRVLSCVYVRVLSCVCVRVLYLWKWVVLCVYVLCIWVFVTAYARYGLCVKYFIYGYLRVYVRYGLCVKCLIYGYIDDCICEDIFEICRQSVTFCTCVGGLASCYHGLYVNKTRKLLAVHVLLLT